MPSKKTKTEHEAATEVSENLSQKNKSKENKSIENNTDNSNNMDNSMENISIEEGFSKLNALLDSMEAEDIGLEASFDLYKQGVELVKLLNGKLDDVEGKLNEVNDD